MKRNRRSSSPRVVRLISFTLCYALIVTTVFLPLSPTVIVASAKGSNPAAVSSFSRYISAGLLGAPGRLMAALVILFQGGGLPSVPGPNLPDLDAARQLQPAEPGALPPIASSQPNPDICDDCDPTNHPPISDPGGPYFGSVNQAIVFNGLGSRDVDPGDGISDYAWTFGDSPTIVHGATPSHTYQSSGNFTVSLTVTDNNDANKTASTTASVNAGPTPTPTPAASPSPSPAQTNAATFVSQSVPTAMGAGQRYSVSVTMRNTGDTTWSAAHLYRLGSQNPQDNTAWGKSRVHLPVDVLPGAEVTFNFTVRAPFGSQMGQAPVHFQWRMIQDGVEWFGATHDDVVTVTTPAQISLIDLQPENLATARLDPINRTGEPGEDLMSGNFNWMLNLLNLSGRAGLNLNLPLSYNSLAAWIKLESKGTSMTFDADRGFPSVGFRLGFPSIRGPFYNNQTAKNAYLLNTPAGGHIELRQVDSTSIYESADSSYLQLLDGANGTLLLRSPDGSQLAYSSINGEYRCTEIKDRNGNYVTIKYDPLNGTANTGRMSSIIDTLGRTINFNYDGNLRLQSITQLHSGLPHAWATFGYSDLEVQTNYAEEVDPYGEVGAEIPQIDVLGLPANNTVSVLTQVSLDDGSRYNFDYTSWGQIYKITRHAADSTPGSPHPLSYVSYDLPLNNGDPKSDCPRFTQRQDWAENWNSNDPVTTTFQFDQESQWGQVTAPDGTVYKEFFTTDYNDWRRALVWRTEIYAPDNTTVPAKTSVTDWTQDDINVTYPLNPRPTGVTISDSSGNRRRTTIDYSSFGLPSDAFEWGPLGTDGWSLLRRTHTDYELSDAYLNRHILGLTKQQFLFGAEDNGQWLYSKVSYEYDAGGEFLQDQGNPVQHDAAHGLGLVQGRGNVTKVRRWDVNHETDIAQSTASTVGYNTAGSAIFTRDPVVDHQTTISYTDSFSTNGVDVATLSFATLAYPTTVTVNDPAPISSTVRYNYDLGAVTRQQDPKGAAQTTEYDSAGRVKRVTKAVNSAYTRFVYPPSQTIVNKFTTINDLAIETYTATVFDGAGRVRAVAGDFPNSTGHYSGQFTLYNQQGRAVQSTNPTEMTHAWAAAGDDIIGWHSSSQTYDWQGRALVTTNTDGTTKEASYGGCGCAGGEVVTLTDEGTIDGGVAKRRQQRIYSDVLGRTVKTELLNWQGGSAYATTVNTYNASDQVTLARQFSGQVTLDPNDLSCPSGSCQQTTMTHDGFGRLKTRHLPEQQVDPNNSSSTDHTTWDYNIDDTIQKVTDARGASRTFAYNARHLVTGITYAVPGVSTIPVPASVSYAYDAVGNRTSMIDGSGSTNYQYDQLSRMSSETRAINGLTGSQSLAYSYSLSGQLKSLTDPQGRTVNYDYDLAGRLASVTGAGYNNASQFANSFQYRAWGAPKHYNEGFELWTGGSTLVPTDLSYNSRLQLTHFALAHPNPSAGSIYDSNYQYHADARVKFIEDARAWSIQEGWPPTENMDHFDRGYRYDHAGRLIEGLTGDEARGGTTADGPYRETYQYDVWNNMNQRSNRIWSKPLDSFSHTYINNRRQEFPAQYDADGNDISEATFDAAGRKATFSTYLLLSLGSVGEPHWYTAQAQAIYDGDGSLVKEQDSIGPTTYMSLYFVRSTVLGGKAILMVKDEPYNGQGVVTWLASIYANSGRIATSTDGNIRFEHAEPITGRRTGVEPDPLGQEVGTYDPGPDDPGDVGQYPEPHEFGNGEDPANGCTLDGITIDCPTLSRFMNAGATAMQYWVHDHHGWRPEQAPNEPLGLGMFRTQYPYFKPNNEWRPGDAPFELGWKDMVFNLVPQQSAGQKCDNKLAQIFGGKGAVASARVEPSDLRNADGSLRSPNHPDGLDRGDFGHSATPRNDFVGTSDRGGIIHVYANAQGLPGNTGLYVPPGFERMTSIRDASGKIVALAAGSLNRRFYSNDQGIVIAFVHVATAGVRLGSKPNDYGSTQIGNIGGPGGDGKDYFHTHIAFYSQYFGNPETGTRIDPRKMFCKEFGF